MFATGLLAVSTLLQFAAALIAARLVYRSHSWRAWSALAAALFLMGLRRTIQLGQAIATRDYPDLLVESLSLGVTLLIIVGILGVRNQLARERRSVHESWERHRQVLDGANACIYVKHINDWRYEFVNARFLELFDLEPEAILGKDDYDVFPRELADAFRKNDRRVFNTGEVVQATELAPHVDGLHTYISVKFPLRDGDGTITAIAGISTDISPLVAAEAEVGRLNRQLERILDSVSDGIYGVDAEGVTTFANRAAAVMLGYEREELLGRRPHDFCGHSRIDGQPCESDDCRIHAAIHDRIQSHVNDEAFRRRDGSVFPVAYSSSPIIDGDRCLGAVVTFRDRSQEVQREKLEEELRAARVVQERLYPDAPPELPGFDIAGAAYPASQACGDYFDFIPVENGEWVLALGDVCGHGLGAALQMVEARALLHEELARNPDLGHVAGRMNRVLERDTPEDMFLVLFLARLDPVARTLRYVGAGQSAWLLRGDRVVTLDSTTMFLGLARDIEADETAPVPLEPGDLLLLATDGLYETKRGPGQRFGVARLLETVRAHRHRPSAEIITHLLDEIDEFTGAGEAADDRTLIILKVDADVGGNSHGTVDESIAIATSSSE